VALARIRLNDFVTMISQPLRLLHWRPEGVVLKPLPHVLLERRATSHFQPDPVPGQILQAVLELAAQAPSGYNLQPWRFIVVRDAENRKRLQKAAMDQAKVGEAPVVVIALGMKEESKQCIEEVLREGASRGAGRLEDVPATAAQAREFLDSFPMPVWVNRHTMIALTTLMVAAETYGLDTAPMEGFDPQAVKREFGVPDEAEVVALLAMGKAQPPDKAYPGRFPLSRIVFSERYGEPWPDPVE
jgi:nitroreductase